MRKGALCLAFLAASASGQGAPDFGFMPDGGRGLALALAAWAERFFEPGAGLSMGLNDQLPADLASLEVRKAGSGLVNIVQVALVSEDASYRELQKLAEDLRDSVETVPGVRRSEYWAVPAPEVRVALDLERMGRAGVTLGQVEMAVRGENATIPGGAVDVAADVAPLGQD